MSARRTGDLAIVLHAHLPWVPPGELGAPTLEERWLFEAIWECYVPLIEVFDRARRGPGQGRPLVTLSISPTLASMLREPTLPERFLAFARGLRDTGARAKAKFPDLAVGLDDHLGRLDRARALFEGSRRGDLCKAFASLEEDGVLELATTAATHAFLPGVLTGEALRAQLRIGRRYAKRIFGRAPVAFWLPECGYDERIAEELAGSGVRYTVMEAHGLDLGRPRPPDGVLAPIVAPTGVAFFGREPDLVARVWSAVRGYPRAPVYREFHADLGTSDVGVSLPGQPRAPIGLRPWAVTGPGKKQPYDPSAGRGQAKADAADFLVATKATIARSSARAPVATVAFDAELFGHFWWEGPLFLEELLALADGESDRPRATSLGGHLALDPALAVVAPATSSWGEGGFAEVWTHPEAAHLVRSAHKGERQLLRIDAFVRDNPRLPVQREGRLRAIRELMLLQSSDWAFMIRVGDFVEYANRRAQGHAQLLERLIAIATRDGEISATDAEVVAEAQRRHPVFDELDEDAWADVFDAFE